MAIPIRLMLANGKDEIDLIAQSIDMSINRNVSAFPTPNNALQRFAVDTNVPSIKVDISGIFVDDEGLNVDAGNSVVLESEPVRTMINFGALLPTQTNTIYRPHYFNTTEPTENGIPFRETDFVSVNDLPKDQSTTIELVPPRGSLYEFHDEDVEQFDVKPTTDFESTGSFSTSVNQITVSYRFSSLSPTTTASSRIRVGERLVKENGDVIGIVSSVSSNTINFTTNIVTSLAANDAIHRTMKVFNGIGEEIGFADYLVTDSALSDGDPNKFTLGLVKTLTTGSETNNARVLAGETISINRRPKVEKLFENQSIKIIPSYWLENSPTNSGFIIQDSVMRSSVPRVGIRLDFDLNTTYTTSPSILRKAFKNLGSDAAIVDAIINVPIKDIGSATNPALAMANQVKAALELSGDLVVTKSFVVVPGFNAANEITLASAFEIEQNGVMININQVYKPSTPITHPSSLSPALKDTFKTIEHHSANSTPTQSRKSAGDKAQDLIGLVSNANRNSDLLRGLQIPYDSLVTSSGVSGVARNFFLTFGDVPVGAKLSDNNSRSASLPISDLTLGMGDGGSGDESPDKWYDKFLDAVVPNEIEAVFGFLVGAAKDALWITVSQRSKNSTNDGGMRIIPEKLHVRYDAGNNYYAFNFELLVSDYVIGV